MTAMTDGQQSQVDTPQLGDDDRLHHPASDRRWRESYYFSFFDARAGIGGFSSIGRRPGPGHMGSINVLWGPDRSTLVASELGPSSGHDLPYEVAGLTYECLDAFGSWRLRFSGRLNDGGDGLVCDSEAIGSATGDGPLVEYDLLFVPDSPAYVYGPRPEWAPLFTGHIDQVGAVTGHVRIDGVQIDIDGRGGKDHSWGIRDWFAPAQWRWVDAVGQQAPEVALWRASFDGDTWVGDGAIFAGGVTHTMTSYDETLQVSPRDLKPVPTAWSMTATTVDGPSVTLTGEVIRVCPVVFGSERLKSWNDRALIRATDEAGAEYWVNVEFAERVGSVGE